MPMVVESKLHGMLKTSACFLGKKCASNGVVSHPHMTIYYLTLQQQVGQGAVQSTGEYPRKKALLSTHNSATQTQTKVFVQIQLDPTPFNPTESHRIPQNPFKSVP